MFEEVIYLLCRQTVKLFSGSTARFKNVFHKDDDQNAGFIKTH
jgi:hypothetical protein